MKMIPTPSKVLILYEDYLRDLQTRFEGTDLMSDGTSVKQEIARVKNHIKNLKKGIR